MKLSIITVNKNNSNGLLKTTESVVNQTFSDFEYIIIDGGSTDKSLDIVKKFSEKITYCLSEPDNGIYSAMNKGIRNSNGEYILFLNSGDYLDNCYVLHNAFKTSFTEDIVIGSVILAGDNKKEVFEIPDIKSLTFRYFINSTIPHPGSFIKRKLFDKLGHFNESNLISSDWEFFLIAIFKYGATLRKIPEIIALFDRNGISSIPENASLVKKEREEILLKHFPKFLPDYEYIEYLEVVNRELEYKIQHTFWIFLTKFFKKLKIR